MWYVCCDCGSEFDAPNTTEVDLEDMYGVGPDFGSHHYATYDCCPMCGSIEIEECEEEDVEE